MLSRRLTLVLTGAIALLLVSCSVSRQISRESSALRVESVEKVEKVDSVIVEQRDTLREVTTITIDRNDKGDTLRVTQVTDGTKIRDANRFRGQDSRLTVKTDTVYIEKRDSVFVENTNGFGGLTTGLANPTNEKKSGFLTYVKWIFALICAVIALIIIVKICYRR